MANTPRGCLTLNDKIYPVYDGHNTIGRNPQAVINIKNVNISHLHAIITIIDKNSHYISDIKSANGTFLDNKKLPPLGLHLLEHGASIKLANIYCTYKKLGDGDHNLSDMQATQNLSEKFYAESTQAIEVHNTQNSTFNELPTQVMSLSSVPVSFNEMPTQKHNFDDLDDDNSSNASIDFMTMQTTTESQMMTGGLSNKTSQSSDEPRPVVLNKTKNLHSDSEEELPASQICPVKTSLKKCMIESDDSDTEEYEIKNVQRSKYEISDDSETDIEDNEDHGKKEQDDAISMAPNQSLFEDSIKMDSLRLSESFMVEPQGVDHSYCQPVAGSSKNENKESQLTSTEEFEVVQKVVQEINNATEIENEKIEEVAGVKENSLEPTQTMPFEIEELQEAANEEQTQKTFADQLQEEILGPPQPETNNKNTSALNGEIETAVNRNSFAQPDQLEQCTTLEDNKSVTADENKNDTETPSFEDNILDQSQETINKEINNATETENEKIDEVACVKENSLEPTQTIPFEIEELQEAANEEQTQKTSADQLQEVILGPPQPASAGETNNKDADTKETLLFNQKNKEEENRNVCTNVFDEATQNLDFDFAGDRRNDGFEDMQDDDLYDVQTQKLESDGQPKLRRKSSESEEFYIMPTQDLNQPSTSTAPDGLFLKPSFNLKVYKSPRAKLSLPRSTEVDDDEDFLPPTQALEFIHQENKIEDVFPKAKVLEDELEMLFASQSDNMMGTQQLVNVLEQSQDDIIDDSMTAEKEEFLLNSQSIRCILSDGFEQEPKLEKENKQLQEDITEEDKNTKTNKKTKGEENGSENDSDDNKKGTRKRKLKEDKADEEVTPEKISRKEEKTSRHNTRRGGKVKQDETDTNKNQDKKKKDTVNEIVPDKEEKSSRRIGKRKPVENDEDNSSDDDSNIIKREKTNAKKIDENIHGHNTRRGGKIKPQTIQANDAKTNDSDMEKGSHKHNTRRGGKSKQETEKNDHQNSDDENMKEMESVSKEKIIQKHNTRRGVKAKQAQSNDDKSSQDSNSDNKNIKTSNEEKKIEIKSSKRIKERGKLAACDTDDKSSQSSNRETANDNKNIKTLSEEKKIEPKSSKRIKDRGKLTASDTDDKSSQDSNSEKANDNKSIKTLNEEKKIEPKSSKRIRDRGRLAASDTDDKSSLDSNSENANDNKNIKPLHEEKKIELKSSKRIKDRGRLAAGDNEDINTKPTIETSKRAADDAIEFKTSQMVTSTPKPTEEITRQQRRRNKLPPVEENDVISIASTSTAPSVISISSTSSFNETVVTRRLSANSRRMKNDEQRNKENKTIAGSPERSRRQLKPKVVFTMMDDPDLQAVILRLGGSVVDSVDACTVLVTETVKRTNKLLCAVGQGKPICSPEWLRQSKKSYSFADPWDYILVDEEAESKWKFSLRESIERSSKVKLLENYTFQLMVNAAADVLKGAIESCGGKCVTRNLPKAETEHLMIVSTANNSTKYNKILKQNPRIKVVEPEAIFDGTLRQEFKFSEHLLK